MADEMNNVSTENQEVQKESAGCLGIGFSFLFPWIGILMYFTEKDDDFDSSGYLYAALVSMGVSFLISLFAAFLYYI